MTPIAAATPRRTARSAAITVIITMVATLISTFSQIAPTHAAGSSGSLVQVAISGSPASWQKFPIPGGNQLQGAPAVFVGGGQVNAFGIDTAGDLWQWTNAGGQWNAAKVLPNAGLRGDVTGYWVDQYPQLFTTDITGSLVQVAISGSPASWQKFPIPGGNQLQGAPAVFVGGGQVNAFGIDTAGDLWQWTNAGGQWNAAKVLPNAGLRGDVTGYWVDQYPQLFTTDITGSLVQVAISGSPASWQKFPIPGGNQLQGAPAVFVGGGQVNAFGIDTAGDLWQWTNAGGQWNAAKVLPNAGLRGDVTGYWLDQYPQLFTTTYTPPPVATSREQIAATCPTSVPDAAKNLEDGSAGIGVARICRDSVMAARSDHAGRAIVWALGHLNVPYSQAKRESGTHYDCSSFVGFAYEAAGRDMRIGGLLANTTAIRGTLVNRHTLSPVAFANTLPGDLLMPTAGHVAMKLAHGFIVHTNDSKKVSRVTAGYSKALYSYMVN